MINKKNFFCCEKMNGLHSLDKGLGINFRVIKISDEFKNENLKRGVNLTDEFSFILTAGYMEKLSTESTSILFINYCPFCGKRLSKFYAKDISINENSHDW